MTFEIIFTLILIAGMITALIYDLMRPGMVLFSVVVLFLVQGYYLLKNFSKVSAIKG